MMLKIGFIIFAFLCLIALAAVPLSCSAGEVNSLDEGDSDKRSTEITDQELDPAESGIQEGYVIEIDESRILVVSDISKAEAFALNAESLLEESIGREAVWYRVKDVSFYEVSQLLRVKSEMMMESYPAQSEAILVQIVEEP